MARSTPVEKLPNAVRTGTVAIPATAIPDDAVRFIAQWPRMVTGAGGTGAFMASPLTRLLITWFISIDGAAPFRMAVEDLFGGIQIETAPGRGLELAIGESSFDIPPGINRSITGSIVFSGPPARTRLFTATDDGL